MPTLLRLAEIERARERIADRIRRTPLQRSATLSQRLGTNVYVKLEMLQTTGAFKIRGAFNKALTLPPERRAHGLVAVSGGNHAQGVACAARALGVRARILMPEATPAHYLAATRAYGAEVELMPSTAAGFEAVARYQAEGWAFIHPFDDEEVMAGQGTAGLEILDDLPQTTDVIVSIGGGGLMAGMVSALQGRQPGVRVWGVETEGADCMARSLAAGGIVTLDKITSVARTLGAPAPSERTLAITREHVESVTVVSDREAMEALRFLLERLKVLTEPAASCTLAAADRLRERFTPASHLVLFLCGGNMAARDINLLADLP